VGGGREGLLLGQSGPFCDLLGVVSLSPADPFLEWILSLVVAVR
jgi:hypothetical protein